MSFPHRTAFYDRDNKKILSPEEVWNLNWNIFKEANGGITKEEPMPEGDYNLLPIDSKFIPLASTGLEDSEGQEIFEGHIITYKNGSTATNWGSVEPGKNFIVQYNHGCFRTKFFTLHSVLHKPEIIGHALTDPELVPDSFDVEEYFGIEL